jgi:hypothetical protein
MRTFVERQRRPGLPSRYSPQMPRPPNKPRHRSPGRLFEVVYEELRHLGKAKLQLNANAAGPSACGASRRAAELYDPAPESFAEAIAVCGLSTKVGIR